MFERILLAVDGSEHALHAACVAAELARAMKSEQLRIIVCFEGIPSYLGEPNCEKMLDQRVLAANEILKQAVDSAGNIPAEIHTELIEGNPAEAIIEVATTRGSNLIVMGSRGLGRLAGLVLGSTSQKVVSHAPCPVLIVR